MFTTSSSFKFHPELVSQDAWSVRHIMNLIILNVHIKKDCHYGKIKVEEVF